MSTHASPRPSLDVQYHQHPHGPRRPKRPRGRWIWAISGVIVIVAMSAFASATLARPNAIHALPGGVATRTLTISKPITSLRMQSYGGNVRVIGGGSRTRVTEQVYYDPQQGPAPAVINSLSDAQLTLTVPSCVTRHCIAVFTVTVPSTASVTAVTDGGNVTVSGVAGATLDSGGGTVTATSVSGPLTIASEGGDQGLLGIGGPLKDDSGGGQVAAAGVTGSSAIIVTNGGQLTAQRLSARSAILSSGGNDARIEFATAPASVDIATDGGNATVLVPGGPYLLSADSGGGPEVVGIPTSPTARSTLTITTGNGALVIEPTSGSPAATRTNPSFLPDQNAIPVAPPAPPAPAGPQPAP